MQTDRLQHNVFETCAAVLLHVLQQGTTHAWFPETLQIERNFFQRLATILQALEEIADLIGHGDQVLYVIATHCLYPCS